MSRERDLDLNDFPTVAEAEGMLAGILAQREREGLTGPHPYGTLRMDNPYDRRAIRRIYNSMASDALHSAMDRHPAGKRLRNGEPRPTWLRVVG